MPIGRAVIAARRGIVRQAKGDLPDDGGASEAGQHNHIMIEHEDGTVAFYAHLEQGSIKVKVGEKVEVGQHIANSGNSGNTGGLPHLHFGVYQGWPAREGFDVPVNFRNAEGPLNARKGLRAGGTFKALEY
jgi:murein DD-endopeptidase MepM/ murein hydrolase activator NlpD